MFLFSPNTVAITLSLKSNGQYNLIQMMQNDVLYDDVA